jgi:hypothetical protein
VSCVALICSMRPRCCGQDVVANQGSCWMERGSRCSPQSSCNGSSRASASTAYNLTPYLLSFSEHRIRDIVVTTASGTRSANAYLHRFWFLRVLAVRQLCIIPRVPHRRYDRVLKITYSPSWPPRCVRVQVSHSCATLPRTTLPFELSRLPWRTDAMKVFC